MTFSLVNVCHCLIDNFKDEFMSAISDTGLDFSDQVSSIVTVSRISHVASDNSQSRILLQILRYKLGVTLFELEYKMKDLCEERISPQFDEYSYIHKVGSKLKLILFLIRDSIFIIRKNLLF